MAVTLRTIKGYDSFSKVFQSGKRFRFNSANAAVIFSDAKKTNCDFQHTIYYGVSVGKKTAKKAVIRNRIKRLMRESFRISVKNLEIEKIIVIEKIVFTYYFAPLHPMQIKLQDVLPAVKNILEQANLYYLEEKV